jgi:hypothetical protein
VRGEQRLLANVDTTVDGNTLHIGPRGILLRHRQPIEVTLVLPTLERLTLGGSGQHSVSGFSGDSIDRQRGRPPACASTAATATSTPPCTAAARSNSPAAMRPRERRPQGSGHMTLVGSARELHAGRAGSGELDARHLRAEQAELEHQGSGSSAVYASKRVQVEMTGSGNITVYGNPDQRAVSRNGSGSVSFQD